MSKIPVSVITLTIANGMKLPDVYVRPGLLKSYNVIPLRILTVDNERIIVDRIQDIRREASTKAGGIGDKYTIHATFSDIQREIYVYKDLDNWYMEEQFSDAMIVNSY
jgi:hypothetical protein